MSLMSDETGLGIKKLSKMLFAEDGSLPCPASFIGIEVELENVGYPVKDSIWKKFLFPYWTAKHDGSLRGVSAEFVTPAIYGKDIGVALGKLESVWSSIGVTPSTGPNTSLQVHLDVQDMTTEEFIRLIKLYLIFERVLYRYVHPNRYKNIFCVPWFTNEASIYSLSKFFYRHSADTTKDWSSLKDSHKYSGLNLVPLFSNSALSSDVNINNETGGHIEFRMHHGAYKKGELLQWIKIIMSFKKAAQSLLSDRALVTTSSAGIESLCRSVFAPQEYEALKLYRYHADIKKGIRCLDFFIALGNIHSTANYPPKPGKEFILNTPEFAISAPASSAVTKKRPVGVTAPQSVTEAQGAGTMTGVPTFITTNGEAIHIDDFLGVNQGNWEDAQEEDGEESVDGTEDEVA